MRFRFRVLRVCGGAGKWEWGNMKFRVHKGLCVGGREFD